MQKFSRIDEIELKDASNEITPGCICLEVGAFRGVYTSGVLDVLMEAGINFECTAGVSAGAMNGCNYVSGQIGRSAHINLIYRHDPRYVGVKNLLKEGGVIGFDFCFYGLESDLPFNEKRFFDKKRRFYAVATNMETGKPDYINRDKTSNVFTSIKASASMPYISTPVELDGNYYLDGGCSNNIPFEWAINQGFEKIVVVKTRHGSYTEPKMGEKQLMLIDKLYGEKYPNFAKVYSRNTIRYNDELYNLRQLADCGRLFLIEPTSEINIGRLEPDMEKLGELYYMGRADAALRLPALREYLKRK